MGFIYGMVRDMHAAEDIFQEVWLRLAAATEQKIEIHDLNKWCRGVAKNLILHHWRDQRSSNVAADSQMLDLADQALSEQDSFHERWSQRRQALVDCVQVLPAHSKELLRLKYWQGSSIAAMAGQLERSTAAVMMALSRVRQAISKCVEKRLRIAEQNP